jgi:hypothetical protein
MLAFGAPMVRKTIKLDPDDGKDRFLRDCDG